MFNQKLYNKSIDELERKFITNKATIGVIGLGYVGLPLVKAAVAAGFSVIGADIDPKKIAALNAGKSYIRHLPGAIFKEAIDRGSFRATTDLAMLAEADAILICVPTPLTAHRDPDLSYVESTAQGIAPHLRPGQLIVLESTTYPGTLMEVVRPICEAGSLRSGRDFYLAFSPEREDPGNAEFETTNIPKVVGADGPDALRLACALYGRLMQRVVPVSTPETAEAVKLTENIFRSVNIALVNELKIIYSKMGIDIWEVIEAAKTKPFGFMPFYPGPGLGGHCIPIDPFYLTWKAREYEINTRFIELAGEINSAMPRHVIDRLSEELDRRRSRGLNGARILVAGLAYKKNVDDFRESPSLKLMDILRERGALYAYYDPYLPEFPGSRSYSKLAPMSSVTWTAEEIAGYDAVLIATDHDSVDYQLLIDNAEIIIDTRNVCERKGIRSAKIAKA
jgi:UDP-N-acetyl-D-glucosamine dehydrogenase